MNLTYFTGLVFAEFGRPRRNMIFFIGARLAAYKATIDKRKFKHEKNSASKNARVKQSDKVTTKERTHIREKIISSLRICYTIKV